MEAGMADVSAAARTSLGMDQFLKLFTTQAQMQNPMEPMENMDFLTQLAQFTSVEQMTQLNTGFGKLLASQQVVQAAGLIGKTVTFQGDTAGELGSGQVTGVRMYDGSPILLLGNRQVDLAAVVGIYQENQQDAQAAPPVAAGR